MRSRLLMVVVLVTFVIGCGKSPALTYPASGNVTTSDGASLAGGWVEFQPIEAEPERSYGARGQIQTDGSFQLSTFHENDGATAGRHRALVIPPPPTGDRDEMPVPRNIIDPKYLQFETSGLEFTVSTEANENKFAIVVHPPR